jgi:predicted aldo/keto reductase-like oxidoreductase
VDAIWQQMSPKRTVVDWSLRWVWNHPEVLLLLSGMSNQSQLDENIAIANEAKANQLTPEELTLFEQAREIIRTKTKVPCTACGYCMPCPYGVDIPAVFAAYNDKYLNHKGFSARFAYIQNTGALSKHPAYASKCQSCHACEPHCPQSILISDRMKEVVKDMEGPLFKPMVRIAKLIMK